MHKLIEFILSLPEPVYCERHSNYYLAEPINALSNVGFFIAGYFAFRLLAKHNLRKKEYLYLAIVIILIGIGSTAFHTFRNPYTFYLDVIPIYLFILVLLFWLYSVALESKIKAVKDKLGKQGG